MSKIFVKKNQNQEVDFGNFSVPLDIGAAMLPHVVHLSTPGEAKLPGNRTASTLYGLVSTKDSEGEIMPGLVVLNTGSMPWLYIKRDEADRVATNLQQQGIWVRKIDYHEYGIEEVVPFCKNHINVGYGALKNALDDADIREVRVVMFGCRLKTQFDLHWAEWLLDDVHCFDITSTINYEHVPIFSASSKQIYNIWPMFGELGGGYGVCQVRPNQLGQLQLNVHAESAMIYPQFVHQVKGLGLEVPYFDSVKQFSNIVARNHADKFYAASTEFMLIPKSNKARFEVRARIDGEREALEEAFAALAVADHDDVAAKLYGLDVKLVSNRAINTNWAEMAARFGYVKGVKPAVQAIHGRNAFEATPATVCRLIDWANAGGLYVPMLANLTNKQRVWSVKGDDLSTAQIVNTLFVWEPPYYSAAGKMLLKAREQKCSIDDVSSTSSEDEDADFFVDEEDSGTDAKKWDSESIEFNPADDNDVSDGGSGSSSEDDDAPARRKNKSRQAPPPAMPAVPRKERRFAKPFEPKAKALPAAAAAVFEPLKVTPNLRLMEERVKVVQIRKNRWACYKNNQIFKTAASKELLFEKIISEVPRWVEELDLVTPEFLERRLKSVSRLAGKRR